MSKLIALLMLVFMGPVAADPALVGAHLATWHAKPGFEAATYGIYARWENGVTLGALRNSEGRASVYLAKTWSTSDGRFSLTAGGITGYTSRPLNPMLVPSYAHKMGSGTAIRVSFLPRSYKGGSSAIHLSLEKSL